VETVLCHFGPELGCWCSSFLCHLTFERDRRESVVGSVPAGGVVEVSDPGRDLDAGLGPGREGLPVGELDLERAVERLGGGVVERLSG
jgi:hypothetical protein